MQALTVETFTQKCGKALGLSLAFGAGGMTKPIKHLQVERPGLALTGYLKGFKFNRLLVFGKEEISFLQNLSNEERLQRLSNILLPTIPAIFISKRVKVLSELAALAEERLIPLFRTNLDALPLVSAIDAHLHEISKPSTLCHGTLVEVFGLGVLMQGTSSVGKSETALGLIERRHRLVCDDVVRVQKNESGVLYGTGMPLGQHVIEIRGIGILNVAHLFGAVSVRREHSIDLVVYLETWDDEHSYERIGLEEKSCDILGCSIPFYVLPVKPGRDVVLLLETIVLNHRLKTMGIHSAKEFSMRLNHEIGRKKKK